MLSYIGFNYVGTFITHRQLTAEDKGIWGQLTAEEIESIGNQLSKEILVLY